MLDPTDIPALAQQILASGEKLPEGLLRDILVIVGALVAFVVLLLGILWRVSRILPPQEQWGKVVTFVLVMAGITLSAAILLAEGHGLIPLDLGWLAVGVMALATLLALIYLRALSRRVFIVPGTGTRLIVAACPVKGARKAIAGKYEGKTLAEIEALPPSEQIFTNSGQPRPPSLAVQFEAILATQNGNVESAADIVWGGDARRRSPRILRGWYMALMVSAMTGLLLCGLAFLRSPVELIDGQNPLVLDHAMFSQGSSEINPYAESVLEEAVPILVARAPAKILAVGHASAEGETGPNLTLSFERAAAVADWLKARPDLAGVEISASGSGEAEATLPPEIALSDASDRVRDRRVELYLIAAD